MKATLQWLGHVDAVNTRGDGMHHEKYSLSQRVFLIGDFDNSRRLTRSTRTAIHQLMRGENMNHNTCRFITPLALLAATSCIMDASQDAEGVASTHRQSSMAQ